MASNKFINIQSTARILVIAIIIAYCLPAPAGAQTASPQAAATQSTNQAQSNSGAQPAPSNQQPATDNRQTDPQNSQQPVTTYSDPSAGAQQNAPAAASGQQPDAPQPKTQQPNASQQSEPQGAATAEKVNTAGGAAAKPAGVAIAPAKQHQARSLIIKIGAFVAAGAAAGTVYALSRGTSSTPPGTSSPGVVQKK